MTIQDLKKEFLFSLAPEDFFVLLAATSGKPKEFLLAHPEYELATEIEKTTREYFSRRATHEPVAYIVGEKEFFGLPFHVTKDTLIPRPETELLVELSLNEISNFQFPISKKILIADIGTGSGAIIISLASEIENRKLKIENQFSFHATDTSSAALAVAKENAQRHDIADDISFHEGNLIAPIEKYFSDADTIILLANLPYLSESIYTSASDDIRLYEPKSALESGADGLDHYRELFLRLTKNISHRKKYDIVGFCEISPEQDTLITEVFTQYFPSGTTTLFSDLSGRNRVFSFRLNKLQI